MAWTIDGTRIYVQSLETNDKQIIARLQPLANGTVHQVFGYEGTVLQLTFKVVGDTNMDLIQALAKSGATCEIIGNDSFDEVVYVSSVNAKRDEFAYQTIDTVQDCTTPVYTVTMEGYIT